MKDTTKKWFTQSEGHIEGPWTPEEVDSKVASLKSPLIWGRGLADWLPYSEWRAALKDGGATLSEEIDATVADWKIRSLDDQVERGPYTFKDLIKELKDVRNPSSVEISSPNTKGWREVYEIQKVVDEMGISRRAYPRVPMMGHLHYEAEDGTHQTAKIASISEGGFTLNEGVSYAAGVAFQATIKSPNLYVEIPCSCEVVYSGPKSTGVRFRHLLPEGAAAIIEYTNKFKDLGEI